MIEPFQPRDPVLAELLVHMAHDLRNPLAALLANLHFLRGAIPGDSAGADTTDALSDALSICSVMDRFIANLDILGRANGLKGRPEPTPLKSVVDQAVRRQSMRAQTEGVLLSVREGKTDDVLAFVDGELLARATENVIAHAIESSTRGSRVEVEIAAASTEASVIVHGPPQRPRDQRSGAKPLRDASLGRGLCLLSADIAARAAGARLEQGGPQSIRLVAQQAETAP